MAKTLTLGQVLSIQSQKVEMTMLYNLQTGCFEAVFLQTALSFCVTLGREISNVHYAAFPFRYAFKFVQLYMISSGTEAESLQINGGRGVTLKHMHVSSLKLSHCKTAIVQHN